LCLDILALITFTRQFSGLEDTALNLLDSFTEHLLTFPSTIRQIKMDFDETMTTSTSSTPSASASASAQQDASAADLDDNLFPQSTTTSGAPANDHLNASAPGELSPPRSQGQSQEDHHQAMSIPNGANTSSRVTRSAAAHQAAQYETGQMEDNPAMMGGAEGQRDETPGWAWKNKKAQEEMQRAWDNVVDRDFSLKEYGDVMMLGKAQMGQR